MKEKLKSISEKLKIVFGYSIMITLLVGGATFFGFLAALIVGGDAAVAICDFIHGKIIPVMIYATTVTVLFGLLTMYLAGEMALTASAKSKEKKSTEAEPEK